MVMVMNVFVLTCPLCFSLLEIILVPSLLGTKEWYRDALGLLLFLTGNTCYRVGLAKAVSQESVKGKLLRQRVIDTVHVVPRDGC